MWRKEKNLTGIKIKKKSQELQELPGSAQEVELSSFRHGGGRSFEVQACLVSVTPLLMVAGFFFLVQESLDIALYSVGWVYFFPLLRLPGVYCLMFLRGIESVGSSQN